MKRILFIFMLLALIGSCSYVKSFLGSESETSETEYVQNITETSEVAENSTTEEEEVDSSTESDTNQEEVAEVEQTPNKVENSVIIDTTQNSEGTLGITAPIIGRREITPNSDMAVISMPLRSSGDSIRVNYSVTLPIGFVSDNERITLVPTMIFDGKPITGHKVVMQGEGLPADATAIVIPNIGGVYKGSARFHYAGTPADKVSFYLLMQTTLFTKNKFGSVERGEHIDTLFKTKGISVIDRLLRISPFMQTANRSDKYLDSVAIVMRKQLATRKNLTAAQKEAQIEKFKTDYMKAIIDNNLGVIAYKEGNISKAKELFDKSLELSNSLDAPRINSALIALEEGDYERVREDLRQGDIINFINGDYALVAGSLTDHNKALAEILLSRLNSAMESLELISDDKSDLLRIIVHTHRNENEHVDSIMNYRGAQLKNHRHYEIVSNEIELYK